MQKIWSEKLVQINVYRATPLLNTVRKTRVMFVFLVLSFHYPPCQSECSEVEYPLRRGAKYNLSENRDESVRECTL